MQCKQVIYYAELLFIRGTVTKYKSLLTQLICDQLQRLIYEKSYTFSKEHDHALQFFIYWYLKMLRPM